MAVQLVLGAAAVAVGFLTLGTDRWAPGAFAALTVFTVVSAFTFVDTGAAKLKVSGNLIGFVMAAVLLGGGPAAAIGVLCIIFGWFSTREAPHFLRNNLVVFAWFPLGAGLFFYAARAALGLTADDVAFYLLVFAAFVVALGLNFLGVAGYHCRLEGTRLSTKTREVLLPVLSGELFSAVLSMAAVWVAERTGTMGIALLGVMLVVFQYLINELLRSKQRADELQRLATTDDLTGLASRERFRERLEEEIAAAKGEGRAFGIMLLDLDRFKEVNDTLGHHYGDELLRMLGPRLAAAVGPAGLVARLGGDEFALLSTDWSDQPELLERAAARIAEEVEQPLTIDGVRLEVGASIGISRYPHDGEDPHALLRRADVAMYAAKDGHADSKLYVPDLDRHSVDRLSVLGEFRSALGEGRIVVYYQPIIEVAGGRVRGAEALVRWQHAERGVLPPGAFMQAVEQTGLIAPLTRHVLEQAVAECASWRHTGRDLSVAVNLSVRNLLDRDLPRAIGVMLERHQLPPEALHLEITESMIMSDPQRALTVAAGLSRLGVRLSVDDFGTGFSSLANLRQLPIDELKVDRSFVTPMLSDESDLIIVRSTVNLGHDLGLLVVAEGVEDAETLDRLALLGCDRAQGYHLSRPIPGDQFRDWLTDYERARAATGGESPASDADQNSAAWAGRASG